MSNVFGITAYAFRFYEDGTETGSTAIANESTNITRMVAADSNLQLRYGVQESGSGSAAGATTDDYQLQYELNDSGSWVSVTGASTVVKAYPSSSLTDAAATTSRLSAGTGSFVAGEIDEADGLITDWQLTANNYSDLLYSITVVAADVTESDTLDFRVLRNGAIFNTYSVTPRITVTKTTTGTASPSQSADTVSATGAVAVSGSLSVSQGANTISAAGAVSVAATSSTTQGANAISSTGAVSEAGVTATSSVAQGANTVSSTGAVAVAASASTTQGANTISSVGAVAVAASSGLTQGANTASSAAAVGAVTITATAALTQGADACSSSASVIASAVAALAQDAQTISASASTLTAVLASLAVTQSGDTMSATALVIDNPPRRRKHARSFATVRRASAFPRRVRRNG
jgi:hypothetical protein